MRASRKVPGANANKQTDDRLKTEDDVRELVSALEVGVEVMDDEERALVVETTQGVEAALLLAPTRTQQQYRQQHNNHYQQQRGRGGYQRRGARGGSQPRGGGSTPTGAPSHIRSTSSRGARSGK